MNRDNPLSARMKNLFQENKNVIGIIVCSVLAVLFVILFFVAGHWILKALFLLIAIGAGVYTWILVQSLRITPRQVKNPHSSTSDSEPPGVEMEKGNPEQSTGMDADADSAPLSGPEEQQVFVSEKGDKYHRISECTGLRLADAVEAMPENKAVSIGRQPCRICWPKEPEAS